MKTYDVRDIAVRQNKGAPRIWLESQRLEQAGFAPGVRYSLTVAVHHVVLALKPDGGRVVSAHRKGDRAIPVIDINSTQALGCFAGLDRVRIIIRRDEIHLLPLASQRKALERLARIERKLAAGEALRVASFCHGGGMLHEALADGLAESGVSTHLVLANDIERDVLEHAAQVNPTWHEDTILASAPLQELGTDDYLLKLVGQVEICSAGLPCVAASIAGRSKKHLRMAEEDPNAGHLVVAFLKLIDHLQPAVVTLENVVPYASTASSHLIRSHLRDMGYVVHEVTLDSREFGCLEDRKRLCLVAITAGLHFDIDSIERPATTTLRLGDVLEPIPADSPLWQHYSYLRDKEVSDREAGKGFRMQILGPDADHVGTIGAGYAKVRSTEIKVAHPDPNDPRMRQLTPIEHARCKQIDPRYIAGLPATRAHHMMGNGICPPPFRAVGKAIGRALIDRPVKAIAAASDAPAFVLEAA